MAKAQAFTLSKQIWGLLFPALSENLDSTFLCEGRKNKEVRQEGKEGRQGGKEGEQICPSGEFVCLLNCSVVKVPLLIDQSSTTDFHVLGTFEDSVSWDSCCWSVEITTYNNKHTPDLDEPSPTIHPPNPFSSALYEDATTPKVTSSQRWRCPGLFI